MIEKFSLNLSSKEMKYIFSYQDFIVYFRVKKMKNLPINTVDYEEIKKTQMGI